MIKHNKTKIKTIIFCIICFNVSCKSLWLYFPEKKIIATPDKFNLKYDEINYTTKDNVIIHGWYIYSKENRGTIIFCHGNAGNISSRIGQSKFFSNLGFNTLLFDYRGYGKSTGSISVEGTYLDSEGAWEYLIVTKKIKPENIIIWGRSLGGAVAIWLAHKKDPALLVAESTFTSLSKIVSDNCFCFLAPIAATNDYNSIKIIKNVKCPILIVHSKDDEIIPFYHGITLFKNSHIKKKFVQIRGRHNSGTSLSRKTYLNGVNNFFNEYYKE